MLNPPPPPPPISDPNYSHSKTRSHRVPIPPPPPKKVSQSKLHNHTVQSKLHSQSQSQSMNMHTWMRCCKILNDAIDTILVGGVVKQLPIIWQVLCQEGEDKSNALWPILNHGMMKTLQTQEKKNTTPPGRSAAAHSATHGWARKYMFGCGPALSTMAP